MAMKLPDYPDRRCEDSPNRAHWFVPVTGTVWRCEYCWVSLWLPSNWEDCVIFSNNIRRFGLDEAYRRHLQLRPEVVRILNKLEDIRLLRKMLPEKQLLIAIAAVVKEGGN